MKYEVRELGLGGVLDQTISLTKNHFGQLFSIVAVSLLPLLIIQSGIQLTVMPPMPDEFTLESLEQFSRARDEAMRQHYPLIIVSSLLSILVLPLSNAALVYSVGGIYLDKPRPLGEVFGTAFKSILSLYWTWILVFAAIMGGMILLIIPGILAAFWFSLATQVVVIERISGFAALKRSRKLMSGNIGRLFVLGIVVGAISFGLQIAAGFITQPHLSVAVRSVIASVLTVLNSVAMVIFYFSARCRHEQFDLQLLAANLVTGETEDVEENPFAEPLTRTEQHYEDRFYGQAGMLVPPEDQLRAKLQEVLSRPEFQHDPPGEKDPAGLHWILTLIHWLSAPIKWLFEMTEGLPEVLRWILVVALLIMLAGLVVHLGVTFYRAMRGGPSLSWNARLGSSPEQNELKVADLENAARRNSEAGAYLEGIRLLFKAMLMRLEEKEGRRFRRGITNRQHLRRYAGSPIAGSLRVLVQMFEQKWYGEADCAKDDYETCQNAYSRIRSALQPKGSFQEPEKC